MTYLNRLFIALAVLLLFSCAQKTVDKKTILAIPVYGQSLALGEEALRITDFDSLSKQTQHRVLTENLDEAFGYLSDTYFKQWMKKVLNDRKRAFELSIYGMAEVLTEYFDKKGLNDSVMISVFPGGQGASGILEMSAGSKAYKKFLKEIEGAYEKAHQNGWKFEVPAFCWMQGEDDIVWRKSVNYKGDLKAFQMNLNRDIKAITGQTRDVVCISYQTNCITLSDEFNERHFNSRETAVPQGQMELIREDSLFRASGPTYPYNFINDRVHLDGISQKRMGYLAGLSVIRLLESKPSNGLIPKKINVSGNTVTLKFNVPYPPLVFDTIAVTKARNYGFSIINPDNVDIVDKVVLSGDSVKIHCRQSPVASKVRYAVNGQAKKSGAKIGPRGNLRDSQGTELKATILKKDYPLHNWCFQFDEVVK